MRKRFKYIAIALFIFTALAPIHRATYYDNGSQRFTITAGPTFPISITTDEGNRVGMGYDNPDDTKTRLSLGGFGSLAYQVFVNPYVALGGEIGYAFNYDAAGNILTNVPFLFKVTFMPLQGTIEMPISLGAGFSYMSISDGGAYIPFFLSAELGLDWYFTDNWGVGVKAGFWAIPELYFQQSDFHKNSLLTMVPVTLAVTYRQ